MKSVWLFIAEEKYLGTLSGTAAFPVFFCAL